jgi:hypothetical protein
MFQLHPDISLQLAHDRQRELHRAAAASRLRRDARRAERQQLRHVQHERVRHRAR